MLVVHRPPCSPCASALRFYFVTWLGERADRRHPHRRSSRICAGLSPSFFERTPFRRADVAADRRHHADQGRGHSPRSARRCATWCMVHRRAGHDGRDQPDAQRARAPRHPADRAAAGRRRTQGAAPVAPRAGPLARRLGLCGGEPGGARTMQAFTYEPVVDGALRRRASRPPSRPRAAARKARAGLTAARHLPRLRQHRRHPLVRRRSRARPAAITGGTLAQFVLYAAFAGAAPARSVGGLGRGAAGGRRGGAARRDPGGGAGDLVAAASAPLPMPPRGEIALRPTVASPTRPGRRRPRSAT